MWQIMFVIHSVHLTINWRRRFGELISFCQIRPHQTLYHTNLVCLASKFGQNRDSKPNHQIWYSDSLRCTKWFQKECHWEFPHHPFIRQLTALQSVKQHNYFTKLNFLYSLLPIVKVNGLYFWVRSPWHPINGIIEILQVSV